jgi:hypothetical protein
MCIPTARQRLGKHIPERANARNNISKHASLTIDAVFSAWSMQRGYKDVFSSIQRHRIELFQNASLQGYELVSRGTELGRVFGTGSCRIMARKELGCGKKT